MILLDTHVWVRWLDPEVKPLPRSLIERLEQADHLAVSAISCWEVAWLVKKGRLTLAVPLERWTDLALASSNVLCLPVDREIAMLSASLPEHHGDPADRLIIATAIHHGSHLASLDSAYAAYLELSGKLIAD